MTALTDRLAGYAAYHRDPRNIATHMLGIPAIVLAVEILTSRPVLDLWGLPASPAALLALAASVFYLRLDLRFGLAMAALLAAGLAAGASAAALPTREWLAAGWGLFAAGWTVQFLGHHYEGRKPAFLDDLAGLIVGPLFVAAEAAFLLGLRPEVRRAVEDRAGPIARRGRAAI